MIPIGKEADEEDYRVEEIECGDWQMPLAFTKKRHLETIEGSKTVTQTWRMKERMKTVSVALVMCLNVGVDPPDVVKTSPCARLECWIDPVSLSQQKALEAIGQNLQKQYERWQPRARYKQSLDPTVDEVKKLCTSLRRNAKDERVLFHYNGHGVPRPTANGEIWVFNKSYTQYIPLSIYDLQTWMGSPSIYVYDCSNAGIILESFKNFSSQRDQDHELPSTNGQKLSGRTNSVAPSASVQNCIQLLACGANELLPMNPELPADLFTSCLTTPIKVALRWFVLQNTSKLVPNITIDLIDKIPGQLNDRRTMLGELNWIFTAITDTIAWNTLPRELFQKLFRQDLLVASLFRNFLLAERIMRSYNCTPLSSPKLPPTYQHPMWQAWDFALDLCLSQLHRILSDNQQFEHSSFFAEQLTAFEVWLKNGSNRRSPPEQLPIVLQVLLSQVHRLRALDLLGKFLDLGPWAVSLALSVGIFPYVLKLLQSSARELRPLLVFIWAKILAVDSSCQTDLVKDNGHKYFLSVLADQYMPAEHRTMAAFVLAMIVNGYVQGREAALTGNLISICLEQLTDPHHLLRQWLALCLGKVWNNFDAARWCGVRDSAHEKLYKLLSDPIPEVRSAAVYALGTFINNSTERSDHANNIDHGVAMTLIGVVQDGSPLVRCELVVALSGLVSLFENQFVAVATQLLGEEKMKDGAVISGVTPGGWNVITDVGGFGSQSMMVAAGMRRSVSTRSLRSMLSPTGGVDALGFPVDTSPGLKRVASGSSLSGLIPGTYSSVYINVWKTLVTLTADPTKHVSQLASKVVIHIRIKASGSSTGMPKPVSQMKSSSSHSAPSSPSNKTASHMPNMGETPPKPENDFGGRMGGVPPSNRSTTLPRGGSQASLNSMSTVAEGAVYSSQFSRYRKQFDKGPSLVEDKESETDVITSTGQMVTTDFFRWCCRYFAQPVNKFPDDCDPLSDSHYEQEYCLLKASRVRKQATDEQKSAVYSRLDDQIFINRNQSVASAMCFHPYEPHLAIAERDAVSVWDWEQVTRIKTFANFNPRNTRITALDFINAHDRALVITGSDDGAVRVWRDYSGEKRREPELVSAWQALSDMLPSNRGSGIVLDWEQNSGTLLASGDVRTIRIWDTQREVKVQDIPTGADSCVTSLACDPLSKAMIIASCGDGTVRIFDPRLPPAESRVQTLRSHNGWVVKAHYDKHSQRIISGSVGGDIRFWDIRTGETCHTIPTAQGLTALEVHQHADILACGSAQQYISVYNFKGDTLSTIKYHEGFMGQRIGPITCLAFHPYKVRLAAGSTDSFISVYASPNQRHR